MALQLVYLIGNGFDIKMGLKTRYSDFYAWYKKSSPSNNPVVEKFRNEINPDTDLWSDLEWALGQYLENIESTEDAIAIFEDVQTNLQKYIYEESQRHTISDYSNTFAFSYHFFNPSYTFRQARKRMIESYHKFDNDQIETRIILFNYTNTLERLLAWENKPQTYRFVGYQQFLKDIEHIHGFCDERGRMALGVDSPDQIANGEFTFYDEIVERYVKPTFNDTFELEHHVKCKSWIESAHVIVVYGLSLGKTDQTWWDAIAHRMVDYDNCLLIVHFKRDCTYAGNGGPAVQEQIRKDKRFIAKRLGIPKLLNYKPGDLTSDKVLKQVTDRIFPTYTDDLFALPSSVAKR